MRSLNDNYGYFLFALLTCFVFYSYSSDAQDKIDPETVEDQLSELYGLDRLKALNQLSVYYQDVSQKKALKYARQAENLADDIFNEKNTTMLGEEAREHQLEAYYQYGVVLYNQMKLSEARERFMKCQNLAEQEGDFTYQQQSLDMIVKIDSIGGDESFFKKAIKPFAIGEKISDTSTDLKISSILKLARFYEKKENYGKAIQNYEKVVGLLLNQGDAERTAEIQEKIAELNQKAGNYKEALAYYQMTQDNFSKLGDSLAVQRSKQSLETVFDELKEIVPVDTNEEQMISAERSLTNVDDSTVQVMDQYKALAERYEAQQDFTQSLKYYKLYNDLNARLIQEQQRLVLDSIELLNQAQQIRILVQENELNDLQLSKTSYELQKEASFRQWLTGGLLVIGALLILFYWLFVTKKRAHKELKVTYHKLEDTQTQLVEAEKKIKKLLGQQVSDDVAQALLHQDKGAISRKYVCIMFLDIRDFTPFAESKTPEEIIAYQNDVFGFMIEIVSKYHGVINQFMGDGFMATFGAPTSHENDVLNAYQAALEIVEEVNKRSDTGQIPKTRVGIGLHAGYVVTGNVGTEIRKQYSITGNTVITAARIEQLNKTFQTQLLISHSVFERLDEHVPLENQSIETKIKGRSEPIKIYKVA